MIDVHTLTFGDALTKTFGDKQTGYVEAIYYYDDTVELWIPETESLERIHRGGLAR